MWTRALLQPAYDDHKDIIQSSNISVPDMSHKKSVDNEKSVDLPVIASSGELQINSNIDIQTAKLPVSPIRRKKFHAPKTILLSGGSTKGTAHVGALRALKELGLMRNITRYVGVSVGGLVASLMCIGYSVEELYDKMMQIDFSTLQDLKPRQAFDNLGLDAGDKFISIIRELISFKQSADITLLEIYNKTERSIHLIAARLNDSKSIIFNYRTEPDLPLWKAIRMTVSIPFLFTPVTHRGQVYVDGSCIDNFPMSLFPSQRTLGIMLRVENKSSPVNNVEDLVRQLFIMMMANTSKSADMYPKQTININIPPVNNVDFKMSRETKQMLHNLGYKSTIEHFTDTY